MENIRTPDCPNCNKSGLAILPVRYAVVPLEANATLPDSLGNKVKNIKLAHHKYALRTLRQGYLYLFYEKHSRGSHIKWEIYSVSAAGTLWKQYSTTAINSISAEPACSLTGHNIPASIVAIEKPEKCGRVWFAFSEHAWSLETFEAFENNVQLRSERMQTFSPAVWIKDSAYKHGLIAARENLEKVIEYQNKFNTAVLTGRTPGAISVETGAHDSYVLKKTTTRYPLHMRKGQSGNTCEAMKLVGRAANGGNYTPVILALWDSIGIAHELNGFRNDAAGWIKKYGIERELEIAASNAIDGVKKMLEERAVESEKQRQERVIKSDTIGSTQPRRAAAAVLPEPRRSQEIEVCNILDDWTRRRLPSSLGYEMRLDRASMMSEPRRSATINEIKQDAEVRLVARDANAPRRINEAHVGAWSKYENLLEKGARQNFKKNYDDFLTAADNLIDDRTDDLIAWLESDALINGLSEFHCKNIKDGLVFDDQVGIAIQGINSSVKGLAKIDAWVKEMRATKSNLIWRAIALNQEEGVAQVNDVLAAPSVTTPVGQLSADFLMKYVRKMADIYKKANAMQNTVIKASDPAERIKLVKVTEFDRLFMTVGDRLFRPFLQRGVDASAEFAVRGLMLARAGVEPGRIIDALKEQMKSEGLARAEIVKEIKDCKQFLGAGKAFKNAKYAELEKKWKELKTTSTKGATALKENRLSLVVAVFEIINLTKISWEFKSDKRTYGELAAAACSAIAAVADIAANSAKHLVGDKVSITFQQLKVFGGLLSATAGFYSAMQDWENAGNEAVKGRYGFVIAYVSKGLIQFGSATIGMLASVSYAAPLLEASGSGGVKWLGARLLLYRLFCLTWLVRLNIIGLAVTFAIWVFIPEPLEEWCKECPFGPKKKTGPKTTELLLTNLGDALQEMS